MVALPLSDGRGSNPIVDWARRICAKIARASAMIGAAIRVGRAIESNQRPHADDLAALGISGAFPGTW
jgi:hypothetical protein